MTFQEHEEMNCISYWFPKLLELGIPVPKTIYVKVPEHLSLWPYGEPSARLPEYLEQIRECCDTIGYPCFLRSGHTSYKHDWQSSCYVQNREEVDGHVYNIAGFSEICSLIGLPTNVWAARELLKTAPIFRAFRGQMPVSREFRFFVNEGCVEHVQPYWPPSSIELPDTADWEAKLAEISTLEGDDRELLYQMTERIGRAFGGYWSVDWLCVPGTMKDDWYCTDMALGDDSFKWNQGTEE